MRALVSSAARATLIVATLLGIGVYCMVMGHWVAAGLAIGAALVWSVMTADIDAP